MSELSGLPDFLIRWDYCSFEDWGGAMVFSHFLEYQDKQIWKEALEDVKLNDFNVDLTKLVENLKSHWAGLPGYRKVASTTYLS